MALQVSPPCTFIYIKPSTCTPGLAVSYSSNYNFMWTCLSLSSHPSRLPDRDSAISFSDRIKSGVVGEQLWLQITEPTEKDTGKYAIEFHDGKGGLRRTVELSGQGESQSVFITSCSTVTSHIYWDNFLYFPCSISLNLNIKIPNFCFAAFDDAFAEFQRLK